MAVSNEGTELTLAVLKSAAHCRTVGKSAQQVVSNEGIDPDSSLECARLTVDMHSVLYMHRTSYCRLQGNESEQCDDIHLGSLYDNASVKVQFGTAAVLCRSENKGWQ